MKTIAVLTDCSETSAHATRLAMHMAKKMKAHILLFRLAGVPAVKQLQLVGNGDSEDDFVSEKADDLAAFAMKMELDLKGRSFPGSWLPEISFNSDNAELEDIMTAIDSNSQIALLITAVKEQDDIAAFILGDTCTRIIDWAGVPVMVVPESAPLRNFEKIAFATSLHEEDINSIADLGKLMEAFAAELMVAHLNDRPSDTTVTAAENQLNNDLYKKLSCGGVYFRSINDTRTPQTWDWLRANKRTNLLAVVQQPREQMARFFNRGKNAQVTHHITVPVLILPKKP